MGHPNLVAKKLINLIDNLIEVVKFIETTFAAIFLVFIKCFIGVPGFIIELEGFITLIIKVIKSVLSLASFIIVLITEASFKVKFR